MRRFIWESLKVLLAAIVGAIFLEMVHDAGYFPDKWLLGLIVETSWIISPTLAFWLFAFLLGIPLLFVEHWLGPIIARRLATRKPNSDTDRDRIPVVALRAMARNSGWNIDTYHSNDAILLTDRLNQDAADGTIRLWGRKYEYDLGDEAAATFPLLEIPTEHFRDFSFQPMNLFGQGPSNFYIFTGKLGKLPRELRGLIYRDIHVASAQLKKLTNRNSLPGHRH